MHENSRTSDGQTSVISRDIYEKVYGARLGCQEVDERFMMDVDRILSVYSEPLSVFAYVENRMEMIQCAVGTVLREFEEDFEDTQDFIPISVARNEQETGKDVSGFIFMLHPVEDFGV